ncbi:hypothetical protein F471_00379 [Pseudomonas sp. URMO17WK12:I1]|uniref:hypothetical protein n=1 Tax=unclassified Pseudomonas TaxID=196821 RepID=UPI000481835A|nr:MULTISPECIES: hypothetical protein [unclassified Pseudomonas]PZW71309.1 hypothetical protein F471_00379 [Pseudomonas sp. URMO17WK12:I1]
MTLIIAGHSLQQSYSSKSEYCDGIYFAADSVISQGQKVLVSGFKKVVRFPIKVKAVNNAGGQFRGYHGDWYEGGCAVAFAGSTLVAQHMMNSIGNHLMDLRPTYENGLYVLAMPCEQRRHASGYYDEDMFQRNFLGPNCLLSADYISQVVKHSIEAVLNTSKKYDGMKEFFESYRAEFILALKCPETHTYRLYRYEIDKEQGGTAFVKMVETPFGSVAVIGLRERFGEQAEGAQRMAIDSGERTASAMFNYLLHTVDERNGIGNFDIGRPCHLYRLIEQSLEIDERI